MKVHVASMPDTQFDADAYTALLQGAGIAASNDERWQWLEAAHVLGQQFVGPHFETHWLMLKLALRTRDWTEAGGQIARLLLVPLGHLTGRLPLGNPGRATVSAFEPMPVRADLAELITRVRTRDR